MSVTNKFKTTTFLKLVFYWLVSKEVHDFSSFAPSEILKKQFVIVIPTRVFYKLSTYLYFEKQRLIKEKLGTETFLKMSPLEMLNYKI